MFQVVKNFNLNYNALNESSSFSSGDVVSGHISFDLTKKTAISSITLTLTGMAHIHWTTSGGGKRGRGRRVHSAKLEYFKIKYVLMQENNGTGDNKFQPGKHVYPFSSQIPEGDFPSSISTVNGQIAYSLTVGINRPWHLSKDFVSQLNFVSHTNTNQPELWAPLSGSNSWTVCCLCFASGPITMKAAAEKKVFAPGETARIICDFSNASSRKVTPKVKLLQRHSYFTQNKSSKLMTSKTLFSVSATPVNAHTSDVHTEIMITIPSSSALTITNCSILVVDHIFEVTLSGSVVPDLQVLIPIIVCNIPDVTVTARHRGFYYQCDISNVHDMSDPIRWKMLQLVEIIVGF